MSTGKREVLVSREQIKAIRQAQTVVSTAIHPDTGEFIPWVCRLSSFLPCNVGCQKCQDFFHEKKL